MQNSDDDKSYMKHNSNVSLFSLEDIDPSRKLPS